MVASVLSRKVYQNTLLDAFQTNSRKINGKNSSMVIPLLANQDLTPMLCIVTTPNESMMPIKQPSGF